MPSQTEILDSFKTGKITLAEATAQIAALTQAAVADAKQNATRSIAVNSSGGLFVRDPSFKATSKAGNPYTASCNVPREVALVLFGMPGGKPNELLMAVSRFVAETMADDAALLEAATVAAAKKAARAKVTRKAA